MDIIHVLDSRSIGGIETHVRVAALGLKAAGHRVRVIFLKHYGEAHPIDAALRKGDVEVLYADQTSGLWHILRRARPDVLHSHGYKANLISRGLCRLLGIATVSSFHAGEAVSGKMRVYTSLDRWTSIGGTKIAVSPAIAKTLPGQAIVFDNFIELPNDRAPQTGKRIAFVGRLSHEKAPDRFCALAERLSFLEADVYGDGPLRTELEDRYRDKIRFHGSVANVSMRLLNTDLVVMPSRHEGLPMTALEAMGHGVPVAATAVGGLPDLIQDGVNGILAPEDTPFALESRISAYFEGSQDTRLAMADAAHRTIRQRYSTNSQIPKLEEVYRHAISMRGGFHAIAA